MKERALLLLFSLCLHGGIAGMIFLFSSVQQEQAEKVYRVSLADLASPAFPPEPDPAPAPPPDPPAAPSPPPPPPPPEKPQVISARKPPLPRRPTPEPEAARPPPAEAAPESAPQPGYAPSAPARRFGGLSAYAQEQVDQRPSVVRGVTPEYPGRARRMNMEGEAVVELIVDTSGLPRECVIHSASPPGYFEEAALSAARKMRFIPGKINGVPVNTLVRLPFAFRLR
ncbi:MAG: energy transducer TonB [Deltaproteobacteria bacterium]|jgi:protein TonB|nr:energy transducer TonB [Deltaproteobacteria bacterium]